MQDSQDQVTDFLSQWSANVNGNLFLRIIGAAVLLLIALWVVRFIAHRAEVLMARSQMEDTLSQFLSRLLRYSLYGVIIIIVLTVLGVPMTSVIAVLGAGTLAVGLALQDSLSNIASGVLIIVLKPYVVKDFVEINERTGTVLEVDLFHTKIKTPDNKLLLVPNSNIMADDIINYSRLELIRVDMVFGIGYDDDIRQAKDIVQEILNRDERVEAEPEARVAVGELADSSVNLFVQPFTRRENAVDLRYHITEQVKLRFDEAGISIPFPQRDIHLFNTVAGENGGA